MIVNYYTFEYKYFSTWSCSSITFSLTSWWKNITTFYLDGYVYVQNPSTKNDARFFISRFLHVVAHIRKLCPLFPVLCSNICYTIAHCAICHPFSNCSSFLIFLYILMNFCLFYIYNCSYPGAFPFSIYYMIYSVVRATIPLHLLHMSLHDIGNHRFIIIHANIYNGKKM